MFDYTKVSDECIKCGKCKPVCTIFNIHQDETTSPRGFIDLLGAYKRGDLELDKKAKDIFESCFLCTACVEVCPNSLPTDMVIEQVRIDIGKKFGIAWYKKGFFWFLKHRKSMDIAAKLGYTFQSCGLKIDPKSSSALPRFKFPIIGKDRALPYASKVSFLNKYDEFIEAKKPTSQRVAIFIGCMGNYTYTNIGDSLVSILKELNIDIFIPKKQLCCSAPAYFTGDSETVDYLIKKNIEYFEQWIDEVDAIIIPEATCSAMINIDWAHFLHDQPSWQKRALKIAPKVIMASKWLNDNTDIKARLAQTGYKFDELITYHDACHAKKMQNISKEPRDLLSQNYDIKEMSDSNRCCGFGGVTMQSEKYHLAKLAGSPKAAMIKDTKADIVSAECSACRMQITDALYQSGENKIVFKNPIELIAQALLQKKNNES